MSMFHVEKMKAEDFPFAVQLASIMNWKMTVNDFKFMVKLEPQGCFVQFHDKERVGIATTVSFEEAGWFGNFIIKDDVRGQGAGTLLLKHSIDYLKSKGAETIGLYAYPQLANFYQRFGFKPDVDFSVLKGKAAFPPSQEPLRKAEKQDLPEIIDLDRKCFGANRRKLLNAILLDEGNLCYLSTENGEIKGFVAAKVDGKIAEVGPLTCHANRQEAAALLLKSVLSRLNGLDVFMYIPKKEKRLLGTIGKMGFEENFRVVRMFLGPALAKNCLYAAESLERG
jgi:N-acetylglutamate synthase-like GNAT family acetyltransferase